LIVHCRRFVRLDQRRRPVLRQHRLQPWPGNDRDASSVPPHAVRWHSRNDGGMRRCGAKLAKRLTRVERELETVDSPSMSARRVELIRELARAKTEVRDAEREKSIIPIADVEAMTEQITRDFAGFGEKSMEEKKALLARYVKKIIPHRHPVTNAYTVQFFSRIDANDGRLTGKTVRVNGVERGIVEEIAPCRC
jgi:hypothetical protein